MVDFPHAMMFSFSIFFPHRYERGYISYMFGFTNLLICAYFLPSFLWQLARLPFIWRFARGMFQREPIQGFGIVTYKEGVGNNPSNALCEGSVDKKKWQSVVLTIVLELFVFLKIGEVCFWNEKKLFTTCHGMFRWEQLLLAEFDNTLFHFYSNVFQIVVQKEKNRRWFPEHSELTFHHLAVN